MTNKKRYFDQAGRQFASGELLNCYSNLLKSGANELIAKGIEKNYFDSAEFWDNFLSEANNFNDIFTAKYADELIFYYFNRCETQSSSFEQQLALKFPHLFVNGVRQTQIFLQSERLSQLLAVELPEEYHVHQKVWKWLQQQDGELWDKVNIIWDKLKTDSPSNHLTILIIWIERRYFEDESDQHLQHLSIVYNYFVSLLMNSYEAEEFELDEDVFYHNFHHSAFQRKHNPLEATLDRIYEWTDFNERVMVQYCFDLNVHPIWNSEQLAGFEYISQSLYENWKLDGERYHENRFKYHWQANEIVDYLEETGEIVPNKKSDYYLLDKETYIQIWKSQLFLADLKLENFVFSGKNVSVFKVLQPLLSYSTNRLHRYVRVLEKHRSNCSCWEQAYFKVIAENSSQQIDAEPYLLMSQKKYIEMNLGVLEGISNSTLENLINLFGTQDNWKRFDRHCVNYDVWNQPFLRIGEMLFCPMVFFARNDWFYGFAQTAIQNMNRNGNVKERKRTSMLMEEYLGSLFSKLGWKVKVITDQESNKIEGDIDVFIEDGDTQLLIQLKRTYFRTTLKGAFYETVQSDRKATQQLNNGLDFLRSDSSIFQLKAEPTKWIVSTSFENVLTEIDGCLKVNYFDLIWMLGNGKFDLLSELIDQINSKKVN